MIGALKPADYVVRAIVTVDGKPAGRVTRTRRKTIRQRGVRDRIIPAHVRSRGRGAYDILESLGAGGPAFVRAGKMRRELRRGLAEAQPRR